MNRRGEIVPTFPKAQYYVQREALEEALSPSERHVDGFITDDFEPLIERERLEIVDGEVMIAPGLQVKRTSGPAQGHQIVVFNHGGERVAFLGDLVPTPYHLQLSCISASDRRPAGIPSLPTTRSFVTCGWRSSSSAAASRHGPSSL